MVSSREDTDLDVSILLYLQRNRYANGFNRAVMSVSSRFIMYDLSLCVMIAFIIGLWEFGWNFFVLCAVTIMICTASCALFDGRVPGERHLKLRSEIATSSEPGGNFVSLGVCVCNVVMYEIADAAPGTGPDKVFVGIFSVFSLLSLRIRGY